jgi:hypothetical protein
MLYGKVPWDGGITLAYQMLIRNYKQIMHYSKLNSELGESFSSIKNQ